LEALLRKGLRFVLCPSRRGGGGERMIHDQIRDCWREVWSDLYRELGRAQGPSDAILDSQDLLGGIFVGTRCVAMLSFRSLQGSLDELGDDVYFARWPARCRAEVLRDGSALLIASHFAVRADARGERFPVSLKKLLTGLAMQTFLHSRADVLAGAVRVDRRMTPVMTAWGGRVLAERVPWELADDNTDLVVFHRPEVEAAQGSHELASLTAALWEDARLVPALRFESSHGRVD